MVVISDSAKGHISTNWQQKPLFLGIIVKKNGDIFDRTKNPFMDSIQIYVFPLNKRNLTEYNNVQ